MTAALVGQVMRQRIPDRTEKLILVAFAEHADVDGLAYPSVDLVAAEAQCSARTVQRAIGRFLESGVLTRYRTARGRGYPAVYAVTPAALGDVPDYADLRAAANAARLGDPHELHDRDAGNFQRSMFGEKGDNQVSPIPPDPETEKGDKSRLMGDKSGLMGDIWVSPEPEPFNHSDKERPVGRDRKALNRPGGRSGLARKHDRRPNQSGIAFDDIDTREIERQARSIGLRPRQRTETAHAFANRIRNESAFFETLKHTRTALNLPGQQRDETFDDYARRITAADLEHSTGHKPADDWQSARAAAIGRRAKG